MMMKITSPASGASCSGNQVITATMLNPAMATNVDFMANGEIFDTVTPGLVMTAQLHTLSRGLSNGPLTITVQSTGNVFTASETININNQRSIYVEDANGSVGSYVPVMVKLHNFTNAAKCQFSLTYDHNKLQLDPDSVTKGSGIPATSTLDSSPSTGILTVTISGSTKFVGGDLMVAHFQIRTPSAHGAKNAIGITAVSVKDTADTLLLPAVGVPGLVTTN